MQRRERTRHLIELGGLVQKAGLVELTDDDRATLYGALLDLAGRARGDDAGDV
ncbi:conjugal transfer protein TraD, partial [Sphingomonas sp. CCH15-F11]